MATSIFFTQISDTVRSALDNRKAIYSKTNRTGTDGQAAINWLHRKMAYATAKATNLGGLQATLNLPTGGGLGPSNSLYVANASGDSSSDSKNYLPKPHINSVRISSDGDWGTILKADLEFSVYTLAQLDSIQPFFDLYSSVEIEYGWNIPSGGSSAAGPTGNYKGKVYNFSYSVNANGGFSCKCMIMGEGIDPLALSQNAIADSAYNIKDENTATVLTGNNLYFAIKACADQATDELKTDYKTKLIEFPSTWNASPTSETDGSTTKTNTKSAAQKRPYVSLERIIIELNKMIHKNVPNMPESTIRCDGEITIGAIPANTDRFVSADPSKILFPGFCKYSASTNFSFGEYDSAFAKGDLSKIMISLDYVKELFTADKTVPKGQKFIENTVSAFLINLFSEIHSCSGERFALSVVRNLKDPDLYKLVIADSNYVPEDPKDVYVITAVTQDSICRSMNLESKVPSEMATVAAIAPRPSTAIIITGSSTEAKPTTKSDKDKSKILESIKTLAEHGLEPENISALKNALREEKYQLSTRSSGKESILYPMGFSATLDGIEGLYFGNTITCNYLPTRYKNENGTNHICFTITRVEHTIANNDWSTTINTVCRLLD
jgi:hypothetical protein